MKEKITGEPVKLLLPHETYGYADFPIISPQMESSIINPQSRAVIDIGGENNGARLTGRYRGTLKEELVDLFYVFNARRPGAKDPDEALEIMDAIQKAAGFPITGIVDNTNLMQETTIDIVAGEAHRAEEIARKTGLPLVFHCVREDLYPEASKRIKGPILPLKLFLTPEWVLESK